MSENEVAAIVGEQKKLQLATINPDGSPHLVTMFYGLDDDGRITFWTYRSSQKAKNLERDPRVTCLIEQGEDYFDLRGVMLYGTVTTLTEPKDVRTIGGMVVRRMMDLEDDDAIAPYVEQTAAKRWGYIVEPGRAVSWDHRKLT
jgi:PPOX class probable F420-dependent enzyme